MMHILGFSSEAFRRFVDANKEPVPIESVVSGPTTLQWGKSVFRVVSPRALSRAKAHFGCPTLAGIELEEYNEFDDIGDHWEKRLLGPELMTATIAEAEWAMSDITLALMEDSGWYTVNYQGAQSLVYGVGVGCTFMEQRCSEWAVPGYQRCARFADDAEYCSFDQVRYGRCGIVRASECLPLEFRMFADDCTAGGSMVNADFCIIPAGVKSCHDPSDMRPGRGEIHSATSRCFHADSSGGTDLTAHCFPYSCRSTDRTIHVEINGADGQYLCRRLACFC